MLLEAYSSRSVSEHYSNHSVKTMSYQSVQQLTQRHLHGFGDRSGSFASVVVFVAGRNSLSSFMGALMSLLPIGNPLNAALRLRESAIIRSQSGRYRCRTAVPI